MMVIKKKVNIASLSSFGVGGKARFFCAVKKDGEFLEAVSIAKKLKISYRVFGGGTNIVFPDGFLNCFLIKMESKGLKIIKHSIVADTGADLGLVIKKSVSRGLGGLEALSGIPGTLGGTIVGNAGAYGHLISEVVEKVEIYDGKEKRWIKNNECGFSYRESIFSANGGFASGGKENFYVVLRAVLKFKKGKAADLKKTSKQILKIRLKKYKPSLKCAGSFFKNVLVKNISKKSLELIDKNKIIGGKISAGYLLEQVGAKGMRYGGIQVADFHGNLFVNRGNGKAEDVKKMAEILKNRVRRKFNILLKEEVKYL